MNLSKRIALTSSVVLVFYFLTVVVFQWSIQVSRQKVDTLQSVIRTQYLASDVSQQLKELNTRLKVLEAVATAQDKRELDTQEQQALLESVLATADALDTLKTTAGEALASRLTGVENAEEITEQWRSVFQLADEAGQPVQVYSLFAFSSRFDLTNSQLESDRTLLRSISSDINREIDEVEALTSRISLLVFIFSALIALALLTLLIRYTRKTLTQLRLGTREWSDGNLAHRISITGKGDLSALGEAFNSMAGKLEIAMQQAQDERLRADKANQAKSGFLANMSHELRTPMNAIIGYSEMLLEDIEDGMEPEPEEVQADLGKIQAAGKHLLGLINEVLDLSKVESGKMGLYNEDVDLEKLIREVASTVQPLVKKYDNELTTVFNLEDTGIRTDVTKFRQILMNLLSNAAKFTRDGRITVTADRFSEQGVDCIRVSVADTGIGMTPEQLEKVFDEFTQADESTTREFGGTGLGLAICKKFSELMKGRIDVQSAPGEGTVFSFVVPAIAQDIETAAEAVAGIGDEQQVDEGSGLARVLVVDDDQSSLEISKRILSRRGYSVMTADGGVRGVELAQTQRPDIIVLDIIMPEMDGWQVLEKLRSMPETMDIPIIMQSMLSEKELGLAMGADDYLTKPVDKSSLPEAVRRLLPTYSLDRGIMIIEEGDTLAGLFEQTRDEAPFEIFCTADLSEAHRWLLERKFGIVLVGKHAEMDEVSKFMQSLEDSDEHADTPIVLLNSIQLESMDADQLLSFIRIHQGLADNPETD